MGRVLAVAKVLDPAVDRALLAEPTAMVEVPVPVAFLWRFRHGRWRVQRHAHK